ncbi:MAG: class I mannose-6-phosphate isomerase [Tannerellaceae bacterium]|jgi:mannose-6-phosphate isomerase|nr:class I mannose-6-phosphate isomerase [Tannerellaceae bacterium]
MVYPLTFKPILKQVIWGGSAICSFKGITPVQDGIGESWELSHVEGNCSIVDNGPLKGKSLDELIRTYGRQLLGGKVIERFGTTFPLLIKFIDARDNLSIQVHPDDALARKRHNSFGKTEMWYVVKAAEGATLYSGFSTQTDPAGYVTRIQNDTIMDIMQAYKVKEGDVFFLPAGRVHAIGAGCFIAEIQQTSNITYRIYDYNRKDVDGNERELHTELAKEAIDYTLYPDYRTPYQPCKDRVVDLVACPYFTTNLLDMEQPLTRDFSALDSFVIYICMAGKASITDNKGNKQTVGQGQTLLIPADTQTITLTPSPQTKLMETYIPNEE